MVRIRRHTHTNVEEKRFVEKTRGGGVTVRFCQISWQEFASHPNPLLQLEYMNIPSGNTQTHIHTHTYKLTYVRMYAVNPYTTHHLRLGYLCYPCEQSRVKKQHFKPWQLVE